MSNLFQDILQEVLPTIDEGNKMRLKEIEKGEDAKKAILKILEHIKDDSKDIFPTDCCERCRPQITYTVYRPDGEYCMHIRSWDYYRKTKNLVLTFKKDYILYEKQICHYDRKTGIESIETAGLGSCEAEEVKALCQWLVERECKDE